MHGHNIIHFHRIVLTGAILTTFLAAPPGHGLIGADSFAKEMSAKSKGKRVGGIQGSPAYKRGWVLGFDAGYRIAKEDWLQDSISKPSSHSNYKNAGDWYRYEYGSRAKFIRGYKRGFLKGYNHHSNKLRTALDDSPNTRIMLEKK